VIGMPAIHFEASADVDYQNIPVAYLAQQISEAYAAMTHTSVMPGTPDHWQRRCWGEVSDLMNKLTQTVEVWDNHEE
jgi:hypothetical protein